MRSVTARSIKASRRSRSDLPSSSRQGAAAARRASPKSGWGVAGIHAGSPNAKPWVKQSFDEFDDFVMIKNHPTAAAHGTSVRLLAMHPGITAHDLLRVCRNQPGGETK